MNTNIARSLSNEIARHAAGQPVGRRESHDLCSLSARILAPRDVVEKLLGNGVLRSEGPVHREDETGFHSFASDHLNEVRLSVLTAVAERVIEECDSPEQVMSAASHALREHANSFAAKPVTEREFSRFPAGVIRFSRDREDEPGVVHRAVSTAGKLAAVGGLGYGAATLLRGRNLRPAGSLAEKIRAGHHANVATGRAVAGRLSAGAAKVADVLAGKIRPRVK